MRHAVLLRAVNVGGTGRLAMADLTALCRAAGFPDAGTFLASGTVVLSSDRDEAAIRAALEPALAARLGAPVPVFVRSGAEMEEILAANPFPAADPSRVHVLFLQAPPDPGAIARARHRTDEELAPGRREIYLHTPSGIGRSRLRLPAMDEGTARNLNTVARLAALTRG
ncbi:MAG: DUF1697 domain-containing protein [Mangrovicoccus sp.]|nr:DUF1697 domain-containing protein [Mangrovicoccus sp.]